MKRFSLIAVSFVFAAIFSVSAFGQAASPAPAKIVVIDSGAFAAKDGITKFASAINAVNAEMKPLETELEGMVTKYTNLGKEIQTLQANAAKTPAVPIDQKAAQAKVDEYSSLEVAIKRKQEDGKRRLESSQARNLGPVNQEIVKALNDFAKQKGYALILDVDKLASAGVILALDEAKVDVTKEFITFFNGRAGAATATAAAPK